MTRLKIVVSDASVLMDLAKVRLIEAILALPFDFVIPDVIFAQELLDLGTYVSRDLIRLGFRIGALGGDDTGRALAYFREHRRQLSLNDCFALRFAEVHGGILMTGDANLRKIADASGVEVHGTLWAVELMGHHGTCPSHQLRTALSCSMETHWFGYLGTLSDY
jgi:predicted nucleic acid-binding protein